LWEEALQISLRILLLIILLLIGIISIFLYRHTKKRGFMPIGISFILEAIFGFIPNQAITNILLYTFRMDEGQAFSTLLLLDTTVQVILAILVLIGVILLRSEFKSKPTP
jgi:uncharacterized membrane protein YoaT (DUF817 family)